MAIHVTLDTHTRNFSIRNDHAQIASLPLIYLEGRKAARLTANDLARVFSDAFSDHPKPQTLREGRERALRQLGLLA